MTAPKDRRRLFPRGELRVKSQRGNLITIRPASASDAPRVAALSEQLGYPASPREVRDRLTRIAGDEDSAAYVAESSEAGVVGWVHIYRRDLIELETDAEIGGLIVDEGSRREGIGRLLIEQAERWASERGCRAVSVRSNVVREGAHSFYPSAGYRMVKTQTTFRKDL
jgi:GNAT superfamily N-acetyltransferase